MKTQFLKTCTKCRRQKWNSEFNNKNSSDGLQSHCKECQMEYSQKQRQNDPNYHRKYSIKKLFNITIQQYETMLKSQNGVCAICGQSEIAKLNSKIKHLAVDHDHLTGKIRGLLCAKCNVGLGNFDDDPELLRKAAVYLEKTVCAKKKSN